MRIRVPLVQPIPDLLPSLPPGTAGPALPLPSSQLILGSRGTEHAGALVTMVRQGRARIALSFGGQAQAWWEDLAALHQESRDARLLIEHCAVALQDELGRGLGLLGLHPWGLDLQRWLRDGESRPDDQALTSSAISQPAIFVTQAARLAALGSAGLEPRRIATWAVAVTGHSQGIMAAALAAEGLASSALRRRAGCLARYMAWQGARMQVAWGRQRNGKAPMVAVSGLDVGWLEAALRDREDLVLALVNGPRRAVLSGEPEALGVFLRWLRTELDQQRAAFEAGEGAPAPQVELQDLPVGAPFHSPAMAPALELLRADAERLGATLDPARLVLPLLRYEDGQPWQGEPDLQRSQCLHRVDWQATMATVRHLGATHLLDLGPGAGVASLSARCLEGHGVRVIAGATDEGRTLLYSRDEEALEPPRPWSELAVRAELGPDGQRRLVNAFTRLTGAPPVFLPGMTPTTAEAPIVAAAANAGFLAELAGGGQPTEDILRRRAEGLRDQLEPGEGYVFNALYLDRWLWDLQLGEQRLVQRLRAEGHPILGVTITAGLPPVEECAALLAELRGLGMDLNSLKLGSHEQLEHALAIADRAPGAPLILQLEGGQAGGHHGGEDLEELLLRGYGAIRQRPWLLLAVGGGIGSAGAVRSLLDGTWSLRHGRAPMPVDAVFLGTATMASAESGASPAVKQALAAAPGEDRLLAHGAVAGGVRSGRSGLGAEIHYLDNHAARTAALLEAVAGDHEAARARHDEIAAALARTAKPWFGPLEGISCLQLLETLVERLALGRHRPQEDGAWLDPSHRQRFLLVLERLLRRCAWRGPWPDAADPDDPRRLLDTMAQILPALASTPLLPEDARFFVEEVCRGPGKPVPFVPVIDGDVHRWYSSDALWQSHDDRYDADAVLVLPGPGGLRGVERAGEPVAAILSRFLVPSQEAAPLNDRAQRWDPVAAATASPRCLWGGRERDNPLPAVLTAGAGHVSLRPRGPAGVELVIRHRRPSGEEVPLVLPFEIRWGHRVALRAGVGLSERLQAWYRELLLPQQPMDPDRRAAWRRVVGDDAPGQPLQLAFSAAFGAMMEKLLGGEMASDPTSLLHTESVIERLDHPTPCAPARLADTPAGRLVQLELVVGSRIRLTQRFLLRQVERPLPEGSLAPTPIAEPTGVPLERPREILRESLAAPVDMAAFAAASGDLNPIHRDPAVATLAGLGGPIVHGQWMAAAACARLTAGGRRLSWARTRYLDTVPLGARLSCVARVIARIEGDEIVQLDISHAERPVLAMKARLTAPDTAVVFPGQGCQRQGMGMEGYARSAAAREVWDRAERFTREQLGFSLLEAVRDNPRELDVAGEVLRHPEGVLNATQITQVALAVLACAQVAELRELGALPRPRFLCGHSIGEYAALAALGQVLELEAVVDLVFHRGATMQRYVPRDAEGRSPYAMGVVLPHKAGLDQAATFAMVERVALETEQPLFVVNHNVRDRQYAVAGHVDATIALARALAERGEGAWIPLAGLDVPFHSPLLREGVGAFRAVLDRCLPRELPLAELEGRYLPNLVARPFALEPSFVQAVIDATGTEALGAALQDPRGHGRALLVELLAWQFASPVRWIETQELLLEHAERLLELGPGEAPVLVGMMARSQGAHPRPLALLHGERDRDGLLGQGPAASEPESAPVEQRPAAATEPAVTVARVPEHSASPAIEDRALGIGAAVRLTLALSTRRSLSELQGSASLDRLLGGNSARRNQVLAELGKELGVSAIDGAHELPMPGLLTALEQAAAGRYRPPGPYLQGQRDRALAELGLTAVAAEERLAQRWGLGSGRRGAALCALPLVTRDEPTPLPAEALDAAVGHYATLEGLELKPVEVASADPASPDPRAVEAAGRESRERWARVARVALEAAGLDPALLERTPAPRPVAKPAHRPAGLFDARKRVSLSAAATWARADALRWYHDLCNGSEDPDLEQRLVRCASLELAGVLDALVRRARRHGQRQAAHALQRCATQVRRGGVAKPWSAETALVTGAGPGSIAEAIVARLLEGGARVIATTFPPAESHRTAIARFEALYRRHGAAGSSLHLVPFDQGSRQDVDALCRWLTSSDSEVRGPRRVRTKEPWLPTLCFPFAAAPAEGDPTDISERIGQTLQVNLVGVERLVGGLARETGRAGRAAPRVHVVLPLSPNHGQVGRDGLYAESKAGLEALVHRWRSENDRWGHRVTLLGARMGWVRGTGLMSGLDPVWRTVEAELGIRTFSTEDMAALILEQCGGEARRRAASEPVIADLTGGFGRAAGGLRAVIERALGARGAAGAPAEADRARAPLPRALFSFPALPKPRAAAPCGLDPSRAVAIVGFGEVGPFGSARVRWSFERDARPSPEAALELAWLCGLVRFAGSRWVDSASGEPVDPAAISERYDLAERVGVRPLEGFDPGAVESLTELTLEQDLVFRLPDEATARAIAATDPDGSEVFEDAEGGWTLRRRAGSRVRLPKLAPLTRRIGGQLPTGWNASRLGLDPDLLDQLDPVAVFNLVATAEAFRSAGVDPAELGRAMHPSRIGSSQGGGIGGMRALRRLYVDPVLDRPRQTDALQEALINVSPAWAACALHGGYGPMVHPVGACATAAVSVELGVDLILRDKADLVVAGAFDDIGAEGMRGFADMAATISQERLDDLGLDPDQASRPCDARRGGFVEAQGGGTLLLCRADRALELGLPIYGLVAGAWSRGDGLQRSIPAPGRGLLGLGAGGARSPIGRALAAYGLGPDDIGAVSIHGTSTEANDPNEIELHAGLAAALGRDLRDPLPVIAQKGLTGHSKGGAAAWQAIGLTQAMVDGVIPPMRNLGEPDEDLARRLPLCFPDEAIEVGPGALRAALLTSLGFGHVGALVCLVHPDVLLEALPAHRLEAYGQRREARWRRSFTEQHEVLLGDRPAVVLRGDQGLSGQRERDLLLEPPPGTTP